MTEECKRKGELRVNVNYFFLCCLFVHLYACAAMHAARVILLTCDFPNGAENIQFFRVQSFNVVIDIAVNDNERSERHKQLEKPKVKRPVPMVTYSFNVISIQQTVF